MKTALIILAFAGLIMLSYKPRKIKPVEIHEIDPVCKLTKVERGNVFGL